MATVATGTVEGLRTLKDNTVKLGIAMNEIPPAKMAELFSYNNAYVKIAISKENMPQEILDKLDAIEVEPEQKTPSQRLMGVLYRSWERDRKGYQDFELYYRFRINKIIELIKQRELI